MLTSGSVCAGVGGFGQGFQAAGIDTRWMIEKDANCRDVLALLSPLDSLHCLGSYRGKCVA